ncbi:MAG: hypothetical protein NC340_01640 [Ruminococcus flavefaciens]|nr:hypothetical protein [Ruminococcus flavefaciens]MCM1228849.1 hypothetical protein [Ruminococcus flavefaciens]
MNKISVRESVPVNIGFLTLYCDSFKASAISELYEQPTVSGTALVTNRYKKATKLVFKGRIYDEQSPLAFTMISNYMGASTGYTIEYKGLQFNNCIIYGFTVEDKGEDFVYVSVTLATSGIINTKS